MRTTPLFLFLSLVAGCGPNVMEMRTVVAPGRASNCELEFRNFTMDELAPGSGSHEVIGHVVLSEPGIQDPFQQKYRDIVRPRACAMGGEGVTILGSTTNNTVMGSGSATDYAVVRKRADPSAPAPAVQF